MDNAGKQDVLIGFIGTGVMGQGMVKNLLESGYSVMVHNRRKAKADTLIQLGAQWNDNVAAMAAKCDVVITMVGFPVDVREIYLGTDGLIAHANAGTCLIDMTTSTPTLAKEIYEVARAKDIDVLDAPVSGGDIGAQNGTLTIMVGGEKAVFEKAEPILCSMGANIVLQGPAGCGQHTKMCNQIAIASNMTGVCEALAYAKRAGLDASLVLQSISSGAASSWSLTNLAPRILADDFDPGFYVKHFMKDINIAVDEAKNMQLRVPGLELAQSLYEEVVNHGNQDLGTQALYKLYDPDAQALEHD